MGKGYINIKRLACVVIFFLFLVLFLGPLVWANFNVYLQGNGIDKAFFKVSTEEEGEFVPELDETSLPEQDTDSEDSASESVEDASTETVLDSVVESIMESEETQGSPFPEEPGPTVARLKCDRYNCVSEEDPLELSCSRTSQICYTFYELDEEGNRRRGNPRVVGQLMRGPDGLPLEQQFLESEWGIWDAFGWDDDSGAGSVGETDSGQSTQPEEEPTVEGEEETEDEEPEPSVQEEDEQPSSEETGEGQEVEDSHIEEAPEEEIDAFAYYNYADPAGWGVPLVKQGRVKSEEELEDYYEEDYDETRSYISNLWKETQPTLTEEQAIEESDIGSEESKPEPGPGDNKIREEELEEEKEPKFEPGWICLSEYWRVWRDEFGEISQKVYCEYGCNNGKCNERKCIPLDCSHYHSQGKCGTNLDNGCGDIINCTVCGKGYSCINGKCQCLPKTECSTNSECGFEKDGCGGVIECGKCRAGFECDFFWKKCVPEPEKEALELSDIRVFAYSNYTTITWSTTTPADSMIKFGKTKSLGLVESNPITCKNHYILLRDLEPNTVYYYKVFSSFKNERKESEILSFKTTSGAEDTNRLRVLFIAVDPPGRVQYEGWTYSFTAITNSLEQDELEFSWDFGDGVVLEKTGSRVYHAFYGLEEKEGEYAVKVKVRDSNGQIASSEVKVTVVRAVFKPLILKPRPYETRLKEGDLNIRILFLDEEEKPIECEKIGLRVVFGGNIIDMKCGDKNIFSGSVELWHGLNKIELIGISAKYVRNGRTHFMKTRVPVYFMPLRIEVMDIFRGKEYCLNDKLESIKTRFLLNEIYLVTPVELRASLVSMAREENVEIERNGYDYIFHFNHRIDETDLLNELALRIEGRDSKGNLIMEFQKVPIEENNPELIIEVLEPLKSERNYAFGQKMLVRAKVLSNNYKLRKQLFVECSELELFEEMSFDSLKNEYFIEIMLPESGSGIDKIGLKLHAFGLLEKETVESIKFVTVFLSDNLDIEFVFPRQNTTMVFGNTVNEVFVRLFQPNGKMFEQEKVNALLVVDGNTQNLLLEFDEAKKIYKAQLEKPIPLGFHSIELSLLGGFKGTEKIFTSIEMETFYLNLVMSIIIVAGIVLVFFFIVVLARNSLSERNFLLEERERLTGLIKKYKYEFYKRHISEKEFNKKTEQIKKGINAINKLLNHGFWLRVGLFKTVFRTSDLKKSPEGVQAALLIHRLVGKRGEFSRDEVARIMREEKYSESVIERVLEKLYK